jgi:RNA polymerase sigma factor (TIGR02999 family)
MGDITILLGRARDGDAAAIGAVFERLYPELRALAQSRLRAGERTLTPTVLVHELYLRLVGSERLDLNDRRHFLGCAAHAMRALAIDHARRAGADKRGGGAAAIDIDQAFDVAEAFPAELIALDAALDRLDAVNPRQRQVVEMHFFAGLTFGEIGELLECAERTAKRDWERGRALLYAQMAD